MAEHGDNPEKRDEEGLPEVEAELVSETAPSSDAFEDDAPAAAAATDADAGEAQSDEVAPKRSSTLTPGVMLFLGFAVVALGAFGLWRVQQAPERNAEAPAQESAAPVETTPVAATPGTVSNEAPEPDRAPAEKIENAPAEIMKRAPDPVSDDEAGYLPPVTEGGASKISNSVEEGAKEAMRRFRESETPIAESSEPAPDTPDADQITGFEIAPNEAEPSADPTETQIEPAATAEQEATLSVQPSADEAAEPASPAPDLEVERSALVQEFAIEKQQLEASLANERQRADNEAEENARLRAALDEAIQRDQAAQEELADLRASLDKVRNENSSSNARQLKATFALAALSRAIDQGDPYTEELAAVEQFEPAAAALEAHSETGVPNDATLRSRFDAAARAALAAAAQEKAGGGFAGVMARAQNVISVRPAEPTSGDGVGAVLSRADHALEQGEVAFALLQLEDLPLVAQEAMSGWIADARARAEAESALAALSARIASETE